MYIFRRYRKSEILISAILEETKKSHNMQYMGINIFLTYFYWYPAMQLVAVLFAKVLTYWPEVKGIVFMMLTALKIEFRNQYFGYLG